MDAPNRNDPYQRPNAAASFRAYLPVFGMVSGFVLLFAGIMLAINAYGVVKNLLTEPELLERYLAAWTDITRPDGPYGPQHLSAADSSEPPVPGETAIPEPVDVTEAADDDETIPDDAETVDPPLMAPISGPDLRPPTVAERDSELVEGLRELSSFIHEHGLARVVGAVLLLMLVSMLLRVPFWLVQAGASLIKAMR